MSLQQSPATAGQPTTTSQHAGTGVPAPYGHACANCARAKCKCVYRDVGGRPEICQRCFRLNKECRPSVPNRRRNHAKKTPGSRTAHLEEKLDDLVSLIRSQAAAKSTNDVAAALPTPEDVHGQPRPGPHTATVSSISSGSSPNTTTSSIPHTSKVWCMNNATGQTTPATGGLVLGIECEPYIPNDVAEDNLARFRRVSLGFGPVVYLGPHVTSEQLRQTRPYLWLSIMACTTRSMKEAHIMADQIRRTLAQKVLMESERSMDLLQALLVFLTWPHGHKKGKPFLAVWSNVGVAMAQDLGLTAPKADTSFTYMKAFAMPRSRQPPSKEHSMEQRRAALALFVWCNMPTQMLRRENPLPWNPHMEECLRVLIERPEWEGDRILAIQVRCALITGQLASILVQRPLGVEPQTPLYLIKALDAQLQDVWRTVQDPASDLSNNETVLLHLYATEAVIHELALEGGPAASNADVGIRLERLHRCLKAIEHWFQVYERIPASVALGITFDIFVQLIQCIVALIRLTKLDSFTAWDTAEVRRRLDIFSLLDRIADGMEKVPAAAGIVEDDDGEENSWSRVVKGIRLLKIGTEAEWVTVGDDFCSMRRKLDEIETRVAAAANGDSDVEGQQGQQGQQEVPMGDVVHNFGDDPWLSAMFIPWDSMNF